MKKLLLVVILVCSCKSTKAETVVDLAAYSQALDECKAEGKDAGKYIVYEECAKKVDVKFGKKDVK